MSTTEIIIYVIIAILVGAFIYFGYCYKKGKYKNKANKILLDLVTEAEIKYGSKTGAIKNSYVFRMIYNSMPSAFRLFISEDEVLAMIEDALVEFKKYLQENVDAATSLGLTAEVQTK